MAALVFSCPECQTRIKLADELAGKRIRCPHCAAVIQAPRPARQTDAEDDGVRAAPTRSRARPPVDDDEPRAPSARRSRPDDDDDDVPAPRKKARRDRDEDDYDIERRPRRSRRRSSGGSSALILWLSLGGGVLVLGGVILVIVLASRGGGGPGAGAGGGNRLLATKAGTRVSERITRNDPQYPPGTGCHTKEFPVHLEANKVYVIDMMSQEFDTYLHLLDPARREVADDDDGGEGLNSRIVYRATQTGDHRIMASTCGPEMVGAFVLSVREQ